MVTDLRLKVGVLSFGKEATLSTGFSSLLSGPSVRKRQNLSAIFVPLAGCNHCSSMLILPLNHVQITNSKVNFHSPQKTPKTFVGQLADQGTRRSWRSTAAMRDLTKPGKQTVLLQTQDWPQMRRLWCLGNTGDGCTSGLLSGQVNEVESCRDSATNQRHPSQPDLLSLLLHKDGCEPDSLIRACRALKLSISSCDGLGCVDDVTCSNRMK